MIRHRISDAFGIDANRDDGVFQVPANLHGLSVEYQPDQGIQNWNDEAQPSDNFKAPDDGEDKAGERDEQTGNDEALARVAPNEAPRDGPDQILRPFVGKLEFHRVWFA